MRGGYGVRWPLMAGMMAARDAVALGGYGLAS